jgi:ribosomal protein S18 acetylase RimI-like enzyme
MNELRFRHAMDNDVAAIARMNAKDRGGQDYWQDRISSYLNRTLQLEKGLEPRVLHVAIDGRSIVGFVAAHLSRREQCDGEVKWLSVAPSHRRHGVASDLLRLVARWFEGQKAERLCVEVEPENEPGREFCRHTGALILNERIWVWNDIKKLSAR